MELPEIKSSLRSARSSFAQVAAFSIACFTVGFFASAAQAEEIGPRWSINLLESFNEIQTQLHDSPSGCHPKKGIAPKSLAERFCDDPYEVICGEENQKNSMAELKKRADVLFLADQEKSYRQVMETLRAEPADEAGFRSLESRGDAFYQSALSRLATEIEKNAWSRVGTSATAFVDPIVIDLTRSIEDEVSLTLAEKKALKDRVADVRVSSAREAFEKGDFELYRMICGKGGPTRPGESPYTYLSAMVGSGTSEKLSFVFCPGAIYYALAAHPGLPPKQALERYYLPVVAHELGHAIDSRRNQGKHRFTDGCYDGSRSEYTAAMEDEMIGDYWAADLLADRISSEVKSHPKDRVIQEWIQASILTLHCKSSVSEWGHSDGKFRVRLLTRNSKLRKALGCDPIYLGKKSCDIEMK